jgi:hypothetical protein
VVLDELPWLLESIPSGAGELQRVWDHDLSSRPILLILWLLVIAGGGRRAAAITVGQEAR